MGYNSISISQLSLEYVGVPVSARNLDGTAYNPVSDIVQMAFMPQATQVPQLSDWQQAIWSAVVSNTLYPYACYCLIGPGGTIQLPVGTYVIYVKIDANPPIPVQRATMQLEIY